MIIGTVQKQPGETFIIGMDFKNRLGIGETLSTPTVTSKNMATGADSTATLLSGAASISGTQVLQRVAPAGNSGERHNVQFRVTTSATNTLEDEITIWIQDY